VISPERHAELLEAWEEMNDIAAFDEALSEEGDNIPWEQVKADLGEQ
jgi:antitoxin Phd